MSAREEESETIEITCPECGTKIRMKKRDADREMVARCPKGHDVPLVKAF
jgi:DNA-directed RNA polymerase subunit RPC12/RpoP